MPKRTVRSRVVRFATHKLYRVEPPNYLVRYVPLRTYVMCEPVTFYTDIHVEDFLRNVP